MTKIRKSCRKIRHVIMGIKYYNRIRNIILIWNIYLTILIPFVVLLSGIWHITSFMVRQTHRLFIIVQ